MNEQQQRRTLPPPEFFAGQEVEAQYAFDATSPEDLSFQKREIITITRPTKDPMWYHARNREGLQGLIPSNFVKAIPSNIRELQSFHGNITREQAEALLQNEQDGVYLLRESQNYPGCFTLSVACAGKIEHYLIYHEDGVFRLEDGSQYVTITELLQAHSKGDQGLCTALRIGLLKPPPSARSAATNAVAGGGSVLASTPTANVRLDHAIRNDAGRQPFTTAGLASNGNPEGFGGRSVFEPVPRQAPKSQPISTGAPASSAVFAPQSMRPPMLPDSGQPMSLPSASRQPFVAAPPVSNSSAMATGGMATWDAVPKHATALTQQQTWPQQQVYHAAPPGSGQVLGHQSSRQPLSPNSIVSRSLADAVLDFNQLHLGELIGKGEFGEVTRGTYGDRDVAVKKLKESSKAAQSVLQEAQLMSELTHENLVRFLGIIRHHDSIFIVTEYMSKGNLVDYLRTRGRSVIGKPTLLQFSLDACSGMKYLESKNVVHRDLAARNILVSENDRAKVSDFGLAKHENDRQQDGGKFPIKWTAPEALRLNAFTSKSDVWSFGILLWEVYSYGRNPYPRIPLAEVTAHVEKGYHMESPDGCPAEIYAIMKSCWNLEPAKRPTFGELERRLCEIKRTASV